MQVQSEPSNFALNGSPGQVSIAAGDTRIIPSDSITDIAQNQTVYTGDLRRCRIIIRNFDDTAIVYWCKNNLTKPITNAQTPPTFDADTHSYPLGPGEEKPFNITANVGLWVFNPTGSTVVITYDEDYL